MARKRKKCAACGSKVYIDDMTTFINILHTKGYINSTGENIISETKVCNDCSNIFLGLEIIKIDSNFRLHSREIKEVETKAMLYSSHFKGVQETD